MIDIQILLHLKVILGKYSSYISRQHLLLYRICIKCTFIISCYLAISVTSLLWSSSMRQPPLTKIQNLFNHNVTNYRYYRMVFKFLPSICSTIFFNYYIFITAAFILFNFISPPPFPHKLLYLSPEIDAFQCKYITHILITNYIIIWIVVFHFDLFHNKVEQLKWWERESERD